VARDAPRLDEEDGRGVREGVTLSRAGARRSLTFAAPAATAAALLLLGLPGSAALARDDGRAPGRPFATQVDDDRMRAIRGGLAWLADAQTTGGTWGTTDDTLIADTALASLALMAGGNTLGPGTPDRNGIVAGPTRRGPYASKVEHAIAYLANRACADNGHAPPGYIDGDKFSKMHGHGFATLALATASANMGGNRLSEIRRQVDAGLELGFADRVRWAVKRAVDCTVGAQDTETHGWSYEPYPSSHEGSMTVTQIAALRAAYEAGVPVSKKVIDDAFDYVRNSQNLTHRDLYGGFAYQQGHPERVSYALTAAALTTLFGLGRYGDKPGDAKIIDDGLRYMDDKFASEFNSTRERWYYYRLFYAVQALYLSGDESRQRKYLPAIRDEVLENQRADGHFDNRKDPDRSLAYCTAMGCLILQVPLESLPIFQRR
jgi:hypothetical protein